MYGDPNLGGGFFGIMSVKVGTFTRLFTAISYHFRVCLCKFKKCFLNTKIIFLILRKFLQNSFKTLKIKGIFYTVFFVLTLRVSI